MRANQRSAPARVLKVLLAAKVTASKPSAEANTPRTGRPDTSRLVSSRAMVLSLAGRVSVALFMLISIHLASDYATHNRPTPEEKQETAGIMPHPAKTMDSRRNPWPQSRGGSILPGMRYRSALALALLASGCSPAPAPRPMPAPVDGATCDAAEARLVELGCPVGVGYADACRSLAADGVDSHPDCLAAITDCDQADAAYRGGCH